MDQNTHPTSSPPTTKPAPTKPAPTKPAPTKPAPYSFATDEESAVTTEFRSDAVADMQNREEANEIDRREQERLAKKGPVAGMD